MKTDAGRRRVERMSRAPDEDRLRELHKLYPEAFTEEKIDFDKLRGLLSEKINERAERYDFTWAGKRDAIRLLQTPSRAALVPARGESIDFDHTHHIFIEGENLEVLKLLYKSYFGRVKMIYIDPPYNTGNDFIYPDNFADPLAAYLHLTGQQDAAGNLMTSNPETSGRYHSAWLSMMYPRLFLARQLLTEDGLIFVSIDDIELADLKLVMNEVFGEENFLACIAWKKVYGGGAKAKHVVGLHEYILCYCRSKGLLGPVELPPDPGARKYYTERDEKFGTRGPFRTQPLATTSMDERTNLRYAISYRGEEIWPEKQWQWSEERVRGALDRNELVISKDKGKWSVRYKQYLLDEDGKERAAKPYSVLEGPYTQEGTGEIKDLLGDGKIFPFPKPSELVRHLLTYHHADRDAIVLDFFAGSCPTAQAVLEMNRRDGGQRTFVLAQLPEPTSLDSPARAAGFANIAEIGKERIRRVMLKLEEKQAQSPLEGRIRPEDLGFRVFRLAPSAFKPWGGEADEPQAYVRQLELQADPLVEGWKPADVIWEVALREGFGLDANVEPVAGLEQQASWRVTDPAKGQSFVLCLSPRINLAALRPLNLGKEDLFICRDTALSDETAANLALQCRLKTI